jgi:hypothetical protein
MDQADQPPQPDPRADRLDRPEQVRDQDDRQRPVASTARLFPFSQVELPWALGPPDGRYLLRPPGDAPGAGSAPDTSDAPGAGDAPGGATPTHVLVLATLGAPERHRLRAMRQKHDAQPEPEPTPVATGRATIIDVAREFRNARDAEAWLARAGEQQLTTDLAVLNRALHAFRLVTADPYQNVVSLRQALVARIGYGAGEQVADGLWTRARELVLSPGRRRRATVLGPQARLAAVLNGSDRALACEELALRARLDLDHGRDREAALQVLIALDAALAELAGDAAATALGERLAELRGQRDPVAIAAQSALAGPPPADQLEAVKFTLERIEAALRARAVARS